MKLSSPAVRRDPGRMLIRPLLRRLDLRLARDRSDLLVRHEIGLGAVAEYRISELLDRSRYLYGVHEFLPSSVFLGQVSAGGVVLDIGANLGEYTVLAARAIGPTGRVLAFEPNPHARQRLLRNLELNQLSNVEVIPFAVGSSDGEGVLSVPEGDSGLGTLRVAVSATECHRVAIRRIDGLLSDEDLHRLKLIKIDVEGWELEVLSGARETLAKSKPVVLYECGAEWFTRQGPRIVTPTMVFLEGLGYQNYVMTMSRRGAWTLKAAEATRDPVRYREPWEVLMLVAVHADAGQRARMRGQSPMEQCGVFEILGRPHRWGQQ